MKAPTATTTQNTMNSRRLDVCRETSPDTQFDKRTMPAFSMLATVLASLLMLYFAARTSMRSG